MQDNTPPEPSAKTLTDLHLLLPEINDNQFKMLERWIEEVIGEDEGHIPIEPMREDGSQIVQINPRDQLRAEQRKRAGL